MVVSTANFIIVFCDHGEKIVLLHTEKDRRDWLLGVGPRRSRSGRSGWTKGGGLGKWGRGSSRLGWGGWMMNLARHSRQAEKLPPSIESGRQFASTSQTKGGGGLPPRFNPSMPITRKFFPSMMLVSVTSRRSLIDDYHWRPFWRVTRVGLWCTSLTQLAISLSSFVWPFAET